MGDSEGVLQLIIPWSWIRNDGSFDLGVRRCRLHPETMDYGGKQGY